MCFTTNHESPFGIPDLSENIRRATIFLFNLEML